MDWDIRKDVYAVIPARSGSKGIKNKNIFEIAGFPLMAYSIASAKLCDQVSRVIVSTNSREYADIAVKYGAEVPFLRPESISQSDSTDLQYLQYTLKKLQEMDTYIPECVLLLRPTTPLRKSKYIYKALEIQKENPGATAIVSVTRTCECPYKWMKIDDNGRLISPFSELKPDDVNMPRQSFPQLVIPDGYVDLLKSETILEKNCVYGDHAFPLFIEEGGIDIDTMDDIDKVAKCDYGEYDCYDYLRINYSNFAHKF